MGQKAVIQPQGKPRKEKQEASNLNAKQDVDD